MRTNLLQGRQAAIVLRRVTSSAHHAHIVPIAGESYRSVCRRTYCSIATYPKMVEKIGGQFAHHDGGLEDSANLLDASLAAADLVICQALSSALGRAVKVGCRAVLAATEVRSIHIGNSLVQGHR